MREKESSGNQMKPLHTASYRALRRFQLMHRLLNWLLFRDLKVVRLQVPHGPHFIAIRKSRIVARRWPQQDRFECKKPHDLVIRTEDLPQQAAPSNPHIE